MMPPVYLARYREALASYGASAALEPETVLEQFGGTTLYYTPFEHVNRHAKLVLVGITPGLNQIRAAYEATQRYIQQGYAEYEILARVKSETAFDGPIRSNIIQLLKTYRIDQLLGVYDLAAFWECAAAKVHATSLVPHAAFVRGKGFAGSFDQIRQDPILNTSFERDFVASLSLVPDDAVFVAFGASVENGLNWCGEQGYIAPRNIVGATPHPSRSSGSQVKIFTGAKNPDDLKAGDPVRNRLSWMADAAERLNDAVGERLGAAQPCPMAIGDAREAHTAMRAKTGTKMSRQSTVPPKPKPTATPAGQDVLVDDQSLARKIHGGRRV